MRMMRQLSEIGMLQEEQDKNCSFGELNCFVINSISNLYRSMGIRDAMQLVRAILQKGVWKSGQNEEAIGRDRNDQNMLISKDGMLFAILHEGVFSQEVTKYIHTFFDGVIKFDSVIKDNKRSISFYISRFPPSSSTQSIKFNKPILYDPDIRNELAVLNGDKTKRNKKKHLENTE